MIRGLAVILLYLLAGETIVRLAGLPIPGSIIGMVLLAASLRLRILPLESVEKAADFLVANLSLLFVPAGVGIMQHFGLLGREWLPISVAFLASTFLVMTVVGTLAQRLGRPRQKRE